MIEAREQITQWLREDGYRYQALLVAKEMGLPQWMLAAGFVRNLVWDKLHSFNSRPLNDIDLIYFDSRNLSAEQDKHYESQLKLMAPNYPWSVKNQARMHLKNQDARYKSCHDAMGYWPEKETAVAVSITQGNEQYRAASLQITAPFGCERLFELTLSHNPQRSKQLFQQRLEVKQWLKHYPLLRVAV
ncbi:nucleotidyltransferase family protein [Shewanella sp. KX20019]|uniref:nucleotidyltransferase family protein n=1 Tax=Shewanella sp. KX20019 TaxID=2803864 RepID=UPI0019277757|nr:nucleotidyltransferase family protein [Shewanella sp. KX20019]QQX78925.1 nucleotidyltransferase family protein [Shewanella sp. KX20019]